MVTDEHASTVVETQLTECLARLAATEEQLARLTRRRERGCRVRSWGPRGRTGLAIVLAFCFALIPLAIRAATPFTDLNPGSVHNANIDAIYNAGITTGCVPNQLYCPNDVVTREQMASFLARTAGLGANAPVANAARLATNGPVAGGTTYAANDLARLGVAPISQPTLTNGLPFATLTLAVTVPSYARIGASFSVLLDPTNPANTTTTNFPCTRTYSLRVDGVVITNATRTSTTNKALMSSDPADLNERGINWLVLLQPGAHTVDVIQTTTQGGCVERPQFGFLTGDLTPFDGGGAVAH